MIIISYARLTIRYLIHKKDYVETYDVYGNKDGLTPQGLAYSEKYNVSIQSSYSKEQSKIYIVDFESYELLKELKLYNSDGSINNHHVGGIATDEKYLYISNDYELDIFDLDEIMNTEESKIKSIKEEKLPIRGDFCYYQDNILWIGDFFLKPFYTVPNDDPLLNGYEVSDNIDYEKPKYTISLPKMVQGMSILPDGRFVFTRSFTNLNNSFLSIYKNVLDEKQDKYVFDSKNLDKEIKIPPMAEGMFYKDGYLYILFESSASKYFYADPKLYKVIKYEVK